MAAIQTAGIQLAQVHSSAHVVGCTEMRRSLYRIELLTIILLCLPLTACVSRSVSESAPGITSTSALDAVTSDLVILFARDDDLWRTDLDGRLLERLTEGGTLKWGMAQRGDDWVQASAYRSPQVSPDGRWIALSQTGLDLILVDVATHMQTRLPGRGAPIVAWSPDSCHFAYAPEPVDGAQLYLYDVRSGQAERLIIIEEDTSGIGIRDVVWSPDGRFIAFACCFVSAHPEEQGDLVGEIQRFEVATRQTEAVGEIRASVASSQRLCWTADGQLIATTSPAPAAWCSYTPPRSPAAISPDGLWFAKLAPISLGQSDWNGPSRLTVGEVATGQVLWQQELTISAKTVAWSPESQYLLLDDELADSPIWRIRADGTADLEQIVEDGFLLEALFQWSSGKALEGRTVRMMSNPVLITSR